tara:strand:+ start:1213 stop:2169 length:957 start_codon:yes stop_codon:yes gene_type:complete
MKDSKFYKNKKILVCGGGGFIGSHLSRTLKDLGGTVTIVGKSKNNKNPELKDFKYISANLFEFKECKKVVTDQDFVFNLTGVVGGLDYNIKNEKKLFLDNSLLNLNLLLAITDSNVKRYQFVSSVAVYPKNSSNPLNENNEIILQNDIFDYGVAKRLGEIQCELFAKEMGLNISIIRADNTFGPNDNFLSSARVIPSLIRKVFTESDTIEVWGSGNQIRTFVFVDDLIQGLILGLEKFPNPEPINISSNMPVKIKEVIKNILRLSNKNYKIKFNLDKPEGNPERCLNFSKATKLLGYNPKWTLEDGLLKTIEWYKKNY